jgi:multidrug efflux pump subunit AcrB
MLNLASRVRPFFGAVVLTVILLAVGGIYSATLMPTGVYPEVTFPRIAVVAKVPSMAVANMDVQVTQPLERELSTVIGVAQVRSKTIRGGSELSIDFNPGTDMRRAETLTWNKIGAIRSQLPPETELTVEQMTPSVFPIMSLVLTGGNSPSDLRDYAFYQLAPKIKTVPDVLYANVAGGDLREIVVEAQPGKLLQHGLSAADLADQITKAHRLEPVGRVEKSPFAYQIIVNNQSQSFKTIEELVISTKNNQPLLVKDVANVRVLHQDRVMSMGYEKEDAVVITVFRRLGGNTVSVSRDIRALLEKQKLPGNIKAKVVYDQAAFVNTAVDNVRDAIIIGSVFSILILFAFLRSWRATLISALAIPTTLAITFLFLHWSGQTLNLMSLGGLAVAIGLIIDDTVVVIENISRHLTAEPGASTPEPGASAAQRSAGQAQPSGALDKAPGAAPNHPIDNGEAPAGAPPPTAASHALAVDPVDAASKEITGAVIGSTLTTVLVFVPLAFIVGVYGQFFAALSWSLSIAVLVSMVISLTLIPVFAAKFLAGRPMPGPGPIFRFVSHLYEMMLSVALRWPWATLALSVAAVAAGVVLFTGIGNVSAMRDPDKPDALKKATESVDKLLKEQMAARDQTRKAGDGGENDKLPGLASQQQDLARRASALKETPLPNARVLHPLLDRAVAAMNSAVKDLEKQKADQALAGQNEAVAALQDARTDLQKQLVAIQMPLLKGLQTGLMPAMDEGAFVIDYWAPSGTPLAETVRMAKVIEDILSKNPDVEAYVRRTGAELGLFATQTSRGDIQVVLRPAEEDPVSLLTKPVRPAYTDKVFDNNTKSLEDKIKEWGKDAAQKKYGDRYAKADDATRERWALEEGKNVVRQKYRRRPMSKIMDEIEDEIKDNFFEHQLKVELVQVMQDELNDLSGANKPVEIKLYGPDHNELRRLAYDLGEKLEEKGKGRGIKEVNSNVHEGNPDLMIVMDGAKLARKGLTAEAVERQLKAIFLGQVATQVRESSARITDVRVRYPDWARFGRAPFNADSILKEMWILLPDTAPAPGTPAMPLDRDRVVMLSSIADIKRVRTPDEQYRENQQPAMFVTAELNEEEAGLGSVVTDIRQLMSEFSLPPGYRWEMGGHYLHQQQAFRSLMFVMAFAIFLVFIMLAFQFRSVVLPLLIFATQPLSLVSGLFALWVTNTPLNVSSYMGAILLIGLDMKNGILLVEYIQQLRKEGMALRPALLLAGRTRFRPILMTSLAAILGLFPLALGIGPGSQMQQPLAIMVIGGLTANMLFTRLVIPVGYLVLEGRKGKDSVGEPEPGTTLGANAPGSGSVSATPAAVQP